MILKPFFLSGTSHGASSPASPLHGASTPIGPVSVRPLTLSSSSAFQHIASPSSSAMPDAIGPLFRQFSQQDLDLRSQEFIHRLLDLGASLLCASGNAAWADDSRPPATPGLGRAASPIPNTPSSTSAPVDSVPSQTASSSTPGLSPVNPDAIFSLVLPLPSGVTVAHFLDDRHATVFHSTSKLRRALQLSTPNKMVAWHAQVRAALTEHGQATLMNGSLASVRPLAMTLAQYGVACYLVPQTQGPLRRNLARAAQNPRYQLSGEAALALTCELVQLLRALALHSQWRPVLRAVLADQLRFLPACAHELLKERNVWLDLVASIDDIAAQTNILSSTSSSSLSSSCLMSPASAWVTGSSTSPPALLAWLQAETLAEQEMQQRLRPLMAALVLGGEQIVSAPRLGGRVRVSGTHTSMVDVDSAVSSDETSKLSDASGDSESEAADEDSNAAEEHHDAPSSVSSSRSSSNRGRLATIVDVNLGAGEIFVLFDDDCSSSSTVLPTRLDLTMSDLHLDMVNIVSAESVWQQCISAEDSFADESANPVEETFGALSSALSALDSSEKKSPSHDGDQKEAAERKSKSEEDETPAAPKKLFENELTPISQATASPGLGSVFRSMLFAASAAALSCALQVSFESRSSRTSVDFQPTTLQTLLPVLQSLAKRCSPSDCEDALRLRSSQHLAQAITAAAQIHRSRRAALAARATQQVSDAHQQQSSQCRSGRNKSRQVTPALPTTTAIPDSLSESSNSDQLKEELLEPASILAAATPKSQPSLVTARRLFASSSSDMDLDSSRADDEQKQGLEEDDDLPVGEDEEADDDVPADEHAAQVPHQPFAAHLRLCRPALVERYAALFAVAPSPSFPLSLCAGSGSSSSSSPASQARFPSPYSPVPLPSPIPKSDSSSLAAINAEMGWMLPQTVCPNSAPNILMQGPLPISAVASGDANAEEMSEDTTCVEFVASHSLNAVEDGLPTVNEALVTADAPVPLLMGHFYFECKIIKEPVQGSVGIGFRSTSLDVFLSSTGSRWLHRRPTSGLDRAALKAGDYVEVQDSAQRPARWEPCRLIDAQPNKVKVGWLYWASPEFQLWLERRSTRLAPFLTHTRGGLPMPQDRTVIPPPNTPPDSSSSSSTSSTPKKAAPSSSTTFPPSQPGDILGAGIDLRAGFVYFTRNGEFIGSAPTPYDPKSSASSSNAPTTEAALRDLALDFFFPAVELRASYAKVELNFGQHPFALSAELLRRIAGRWVDPASDARLAQRLSVWEAQRFSAEIAARKDRERARAEDEAVRVHRLAMAIDLVPFFPGLSESQISYALELNGDDASRTVNWALEQPDLLEAVLALEAKKKPQAAAAAATVASPLASPSAKSSSASVSSSLSTAFASDLLPPFNRAQFNSRLCLPLSHALEEPVDERALDLAAAAAAAGAVAAGVGSDDANDGQSAELRQWLTEVESGLRRARVDRASIERILARLRDDPRDMVSLLQAREVIPNLRDAPQPADSVVAAAAESVAAAAAAASSVNVTTTSFVSNVSASAGDLSDSTVTEFNSDLLSTFISTQSIMASADRESTPSVRPGTSASSASSLHLQTRVHLRQSTSALDIPVGSRVWIVRNAAEPARDKDLWLPAMASSCARFGSVVSTSSRSGAGAMALVQLVDHERSSVQEWWFPLECLRLVSVAPSASSSSSATMLGSSSTESSTNLFSASSWSASSSAASSSASASDADSVLSSLPALSDCYLQLARVFSRRALLALQHGLQQLQEQPDQGAALSDEVQSSSARPLSDHWVASFESDQLLRAACGEYLSPLSEVTGHIMSAIHPLIRSNPQSRHASLPLSTVKQVARPLWSVLQTQPDICILIENLLHVACHQITQQTRIVHLPSSTSSSSTSSSSSSSTTLARGPIVNIELPDSHGMIISVYSSANALGSTSAPRRAKGTIPAHLSVYTQPGSRQALRHLLVPSAPPVVVPLHAVWLQYCAGTAASTTTSSASTNPPPPSTLDVLVQPLPWQFSLAAYLVQYICEPSSSQSSSSPSISHAELLRLLDRCLCALQCEWMPLPLRQRLVGLSLVLLDAMHARLPASSYPTDLLWSSLSSESVSALQSLQSEVLTLHDKSIKAHETVLPVWLQHSIELLVQLHASGQHLHRETVHHRIDMSSQDDTSSSSSLPSLQLMPQSPHTKAVIQLFAPANASFDFTSLPSPSSNSNRKWPSWFLELSELTCALQHLCTRHDCLPYEFVVNAIMQAGADNQSSSTPSASSLSSSSSTSTAPPVSLSASVLQPHQQNECLDAMALDLSVRLMAEEENSIAYDQEDESKQSDEAKPWCLEDDVELIRLWQEHALASHLPAQEVAASTSTLCKMLARAPRTCLSEHSLELLLARWLALHRFNVLLARTLPLFDWRRALCTGSLANCVSRCRHLMLSGLKTTFFNRVIQAQNALVAGGSGPSDSGVGSRVPLFINRFAAASATAGRGNSIFEQAFKQLAGVNANWLRGASPLDVRLQGEKVLGEGGPYRAFFSDICRELQSAVPLAVASVVSSSASSSSDLPPVHTLSLSRGSSAASPLSSASTSSPTSLTSLLAAATSACPLPSACPLLFIASPNARSRVGSLRDKFVINPSAKSPENLSMFRFIGRLMALAVRTSVTLSLDLVPRIWKVLTYEAVTVDDLEQIDVSLVDGLLRPLRRCTDRAAFERQFPPGTLTFTGSDSSGALVELVPHGASRPVTFANRYHYADLLERARLAEGLIQLDEIRAGMAELLPAPLFASFTGAELEELVCGRATVDLALLRKHTEYGGDLHAGHPLVVGLWRVLEEMTEAQRVRFIEFVYAQRRLPSAETFRQQRLRLLVNPLRPPLASVSPDSMFPHSDTCFMNLKLPLYSSVAVLQEKLLLAISSDSGFGTNEEEQQLNSIFN